MKKSKLTPLLCAVIGIGEAQHVRAGAAPAEPAAQTPGEQIEQIVVIGRSLGAGESRANSVIDRDTLLQQPPGLDPLKVLTRVPGLRVSSGDDLTGSFSMRMSMRGMNKEQIGISIDGIPNGSTLSNGGTMPTRLLDPANLLQIDVSQSAGDIGTPSNQALGGYIDFKTRDPSRTAGGDAEIAGGNYRYQREFIRVDTGEFGPALTAYVDASHSFVRTWPGDQSGRSRKDHADLRILKDFDNGSSLRGTVSHNSMSDNDYDAVALRAASRYKAVFEVDPTTDGLTDSWTGNPAIDQNSRRTRGIDSNETFAHLDGTFKLTQDTAVSLKPYYQHQNGAGWFYVPYKQLPVNGEVYSAVPAGGSPTGVVQECYASEYQRTATGALIPTSAVALPAGVTAATLSAAGCPAAARFAMNPSSQWGAREATRRRGGYQMDRTGSLGEISTTLGDSNHLRLGGWYEYIRRKKTRNWYSVTDPTRGFDYLESALYSITQDRLYRSHTAMAYAQDQIGFWNGRAQLDVGGTYQHFSEVYASPVEFNGSRALTVSSKLLPKVGILYRINGRTEVFGSASKNFSALPDSVFESAAAIDARKGIKPETSTNKDLGLRYFTPGLGLSFQVYSIDYRDRISIQNGNPNGDIFSRDATTTFENQGGITSRGAELTARTAWGTSFDFYAAYAYDDAHYVADTPAEGIREGDPVLGVSRQNAFAEVTWRPTTRWRLTCNANYVGRAAGTYHEVANTLVSGAVPLPREYMPSYTLVGVSGNYSPGGTVFGIFHDTEIGFNVDNLFDKRYLGGLGAELTTSNPLTSGRYFLGSPRTFYVALRTHL